MQLRGLSALPRCVCVAHQLCCDCAPDQALVPAAAAGLRTAADAAADAGGETASARGLCVYRYLDLMWTDLRAFAANCGHNSWIGDDCVSICWLALPCSCGQDYGIYKNDNRNGSCGACGVASLVFATASPRWFLPPHHLRRAGLLQRHCLYPLAVHVQRRYLSGVTLRMQTGCYHLACVRLHSALIRVQHLHSALSG